MKRHNLHCAVSQGFREPGKSLVALRQSQQRVGRVCCDATDRLTSATNRDWQERNFTPVFKVSSRMGAETERAQWHDSAQSDPVWAFQRRVLRPSNAATRRSASARILAQNRA